MKVFKDYKVLVATDANEIAVFVKQHIKDGWSVKGGIATVAVNMNYTNFAQAVVKFEK